MSGQPFIKMHGLGNDFVVLDLRARPLRLDAPHVRVIADRRTGVGCDQLICIEPSARADVFMRIFNADGSEAEMCGNGVRCVAKYAYEHGLVALTVIWCTVPPCIVFRNQASTPASIAITAMIVPSSAVRNRST